MVIYIFPPVKTHLENPAKKLQTHISISLLSNLNGPIFLFLYYPVRADTYLYLSTLEPWIIQLKAVVNDLIDIMQPAKQLTKR